MLYNMIELGKVNSELAESSDRAAAVLGAVLLEGILGQLIQSLLVRAPGVSRRVLGRGSDRAALSTFYQRIEVAHGLGLLGADEYADLDAIRRIRNYFAHGKQGVSFVDDKPRKLCASLTGPPELIRGYCVDNAQPRPAYEFAVLLLLHEIDMRIDEVSEPRPSRPQSYHWLKQHYKDGVSWDNWLFQTRDGDVIAVT